MPAVITLDQRSSRTGSDLVPTWLNRLNHEFEDSLRLPFVRTVGDELQALAKHPEVLTELLLRGVRFEQWWVGIGIGEVDEPLGSSSADSRGSAFYRARNAVNLAKESRYGFSIVGTEDKLDREITVIFNLLSFVVQRRGSSEGSKSWEAVELATTELNQREIGERLNISRQAAWQRLKVAGWDEEREGRWMVNDLLAAAMGNDERPR
jgi:SatD family (SatD)